MSRLADATVTCPACQASVDTRLVESLDADRHPELRSAILDASLQAVTCGACSNTFRIAPHLSHLDVGRGQWIAGMPAARMADWPTAEDETRALLATAFGAAASATAQALGADLQARLCLGWPAIREKIFLREAGLDDVTVEMLKMDLMRRVKSAPLVAGVEMRVVAIEEPALRVVWIDAETEAITQSVKVKRALYDAIVAAPEAWAKLRADLTDGPFVDAQKLYVGQGRPAA